MSESGGMPETKESPGDGSPGAASPGARAPGTESPLAGAAWPGELRPYQREALAKDEALVPSL